MEIVLPIFVVGLILVIWLIALIYWLDSKK